MLVSAATSLFIIIYLLGLCPGICTIWHCWQLEGVVGLHLCLQVGDKVAFEEIQLFCVCRLACQDPSLYLFVLVIFLNKALVLPHTGIHITFNFFYAGHCSQVVQFIHK